MTGCGGTWELRLNPLNCGMGVQNTTGENNLPNLSRVQTIKPWHPFVGRKDLRCSVVAQVMQQSKGR